MANVIPMAGEGKRFLDAGYGLPKPLIAVSGRPMIINAVRNMPKSDKWIFIVLQEHIDKYKIDEIIKKEVADAIIVSVSKVTEGQACTCMLAEPYLEKDEPVFIAACDNSYLYNREKYELLLEDKSVDSIVWSFTRHETLRKNPNARGWCVLEDDGITIKGMSVKTPISSDPYNDHAVVASFFFRRLKDFIDAVRMMIKEDYRINNEFYVDAVPIFMKKLEKRSVIFDIDYYFDWGNPRDLYEYQRLESFVRSGSKLIMPDEVNRVLPLLQKYFSGINND